MDSLSKILKDHSKQLSLGSHFRNRLSPLKRTEYAQNNEAKEGDNDTSAKIVKEKLRNEQGRNGRWIKGEHELFIQGCLAYGNNWKKMKQIVKTRTSAQIRSHAQKYLIKLAKKHHDYLKNTNQERSDLKLKGKATLPGIVLGKEDLELNREEIEKLILSIFQIKSNASGSRLNTKDERDNDSSSENSNNNNKKKFASIKNHTNINNTNRNNYFFLFAEKEKSLDKLSNLNSNESNQLNELQSQSNIINNNNIHQNIGNYFNNIPPQYRSSIPINTLINASSNFNLQLNTNLIQQIPFSRGYNFDSYFNPYHYLYYPQIEYANL